jgi:hypothetical protein
MVRGLLQTRRLQVITAIVMMVCFLALLIPHSGSSGPFVACVLFFPVFLFGLLDLQQMFRNVVRADETLLPQAPVLSALFQRPPPSFD